MAFFLLFLVGVVVFIYLNGKINRLENILRQNQQVSPQVVQPPVAPVPPLSAQTLSVPVPPPPSIMAAVPAPTPRHDLEFRLGSKFFTAVGSLAVILGIGFFLRYAFERNLISEVMRVVLGLVAGGALTGTGEYLRKKFASYGQALMGTGLAILYLTFYAAFNYYGVFTFVGAFLGMILVTMIGAALAVRHDSLPLAGFAQLGGFVTPFLVIRGLNDLHVLFLYVALLDIGMLLIALWRTWRVLTIGSLLGTALVYIIWHLNFYTHDLFGPAMFYLSLFFLIFLAATLTRLFVTKIRTDENDLALIMFNPLFYFLAGYALIHPLYPEAVGVFAFGLALLHLIVGAIAGRNETTSNSKYFLYGVGFLLMFVAIALQFNGSWITVGWAAEALVLHFLGKRGRVSFFRNSGHVIFVIASIRFATVDLSVKSAVPLFNGAGLTLILMLLCLIAGFLVYRLRHPILGNASEEIAEPSDHENESILASEAYVLILIWLTSQVVIYYPFHWLPISWSLLAFVAGIIALFGRVRPVRLLSYATFALAGFRLLMFDSNLDLSGFVPFFNFRALSFAITALLAGVYAYLIYDSQEAEQRERSWVAPVFFFCINLLVLWALSLEVLDYYNLRISELPTGELARINSLTYTKNAVLSVVWAVYAVAMLGIGLFLKSLSARLFSIILFGLVIFKVFLYDPANLNNLYRFVSFLSLGLILLLTGYLYNRYKDRISEFILTKE